MKMKGIVSLTLAFVAIVGTPSIAAAHTSTPSADCDNVTLKFTSFASGSNTVHYSVNDTENKATFTGGSKTVTVPIRSYAGDTIQVRTWWIKSETSDGHYKDESWKITPKGNCGDKPKPEPPKEEPPVVIVPKPEPTPTVTPEPTPIVVTPTPAPIVAPPVPIAAPPPVIVPFKPLTSGPDRCVNKKFKVSVTGKNISHVLFTFGNDRVIVDKRDKSGAYRASVTTLKGLKRGRKLTIKVYIVSLDGDLQIKHIPFRRCSAAKKTPKFTG